MANKAMAFNADQVEALVVAGKAMTGAVTDSFETCEKVFKLIEGEDVFGASEHKEKIMESIAVVRKFAEELKVKTDKMANMVDQTAQQFKEALSVNMKSVEDATAQLTAAKNKALSK